MLLWCVKYASRNEVKIQRSCTQNMNFLAGEREWTKPAATTHFRCTDGDRWSSSFTIEIVKVLQFEQSLSDFYGPSPSTKNDFECLFTQNTKIIAPISFFGL